MKLNADDIKSIAHLAQLEVPSSQTTSLTQDINKILTLVAQMGQLDTSQVEPLAHPLDVSQPLRMDTVTESNQRDLFQKIAPETEAGLYIVPQVIDGE